MKSLSNYIAESLTNWEDLAIDAIEIMYNWIDNDSDQLKRLKKFVDGTDKNNEVYTDLITELTDETYDWEPSIFDNPKAIDALIRGAKEVLSKKR